MNGDSYAEQQNLIISHKNESNQYFSNSIVVNGL